MISKCRDHPGKGTTSINTVKVGKSPYLKEICAMMEINGKAAQFHIDSAASINVITQDLVGNRTLKPTEMKLRMWNKTEVVPLGAVRLVIGNPRNKKKHSVEFVVEEIKDYHHSSVPKHRIKLRFRRATNKTNCNCHVDHSRREIGTSIPKDFRTSRWHIPRCCSSRSRTRRMAGYSTPTSHTNSVKDIIQE